MYYNINIGLFGQFNIEHQAHISRANYTCMVGPADIVGLTAKVVWLIVLFSNSELIFVQLLCWPLAGRHHVVSGLRLLMFIDLK